MTVSCAKFECAFSEMPTLTSLSDPGSAQHRATRRTDRQGTEEEVRCPRQESNLGARFRKPALYPLSYGGSGKWYVAGSVQNRSGTTTVRPTFPGARGRTSVGDVHRRSGHGGGRDTRSAVSAARRAR